MGVPCTFYTKIVFFFGLDVDVILDELGWRMLRSGRTGQPPHGGVPQIGVRPVRPLRRATCAMPIVTIFPVLVIPVFPRGVVTQYAGAVVGKGGGRFVVPHHEAAALAEYRAATVQPHRPIAASANSQRRPHNAHGLRATDND